MNMEDNTLLLKKYNNRRLYDTEKSIYVTLDYVTDVVRQGRKIKVTDAKTGEDVTSAILTQIVLEEARKKKYLLPPPLLYLIIQHGDRLRSEPAKFNNAFPFDFSRRRDHRRTKSADR